MRFRDKRLNSTLPPPTKLFRQVTQMMTENQLTIILLECHLIKHLVQSCVCVWFTCAKFKKRNKTNKQTKIKTTQALARYWSNIQDTYGNRTSLLTERRAFQPQGDFSSCSQFPSPVGEFGNIPAECEYTNCEGLD